MIYSALRPIYSSTKAAFLNEDISDNVVSIFLCGANSSSKVSLREKIKVAIHSRKSKYTYRVYYPEDLFLELVYGHQRRDLLALENILASSVHAVVILLESPGTIAELGAFSNHDTLSNKLVVLVDSKYKDANSFINRGPLRHLKNNTKSFILPVSFREAEISYIAERICEASRKLASQNVVAPNVRNPISAYRFFLALVYLFDPVKREFLFKLISHNEGAEADVLDVAEAIINSLNADGMIYASKKGLSTTSKGNEHLFSSGGLKATTERTAKFLYSERIKCLNILLRRYRES